MKSLESRLGVHLARLRHRLRQGDWSSLSEEMMPAAYWHPNHFLKLRVAEDSDGASFRVHLWPALDHLLSADDIHSHRWAYHSVILHGALRITTYREVAGGTHLARRYTCSPNDDGAYALTPDVVVSLSVTSSAIVSAGMTHSGVTSTIHKTEVVGPRPVLSAFMQSAATSSRSHVYSEDLSGVAQTRARSRPDPNDLRLVFELLLSTEGLGK